MGFLHWRFGWVGLWFSPRFCCFWRPGLVIGALPFVVIVMPKAAPSACRQRGCSVLVRDGSGFCDAHRKEARKEVDDRRGNSAERGYGERWRKARKGYLRKHSMCAECTRRGFVASATVVDHIIPHRGDFAFLFWESAHNWQPLCEGCHNEKTGAVDKAMSDVEWCQARLALARRIGVEVDAEVRGRGWSKV